jgi:TetR/AcrR family transcriptional regulator, transcriptional repressor for nem operon
MRYLCVDPEMTMPAPKQHDTETFVDSAMRVFWARGYEGTSINDLVQATGINRGSIYASFDGKRDIFLAALASYDDRYRARFLAGLKVGRGPKEAILAAFRAAADQVPTASMPAGCLIVNSAVELAPHDPEIAQAVNASLGELRAFFRDRIEAAKAADEIGPLDTEATTTTLYALFLGLRVMARSNAPADQRDLIVQQANQILA